MSDTEPNTTTEQFSELANGVAESAKESATGAAKEAATEKAKSGITSGGGVVRKLLSRGLSASDGVSVEAVQKSYDCSKGSALIVRGVTRMCDLKDIPGGMDVIAGFALLVKSASENQGDDSGE